MGYTYTQWGTPHTWLHNPISLCCTQDLEARKAIAADSKQCPKCCVECYRSEGCNQVMCKACRHVFNWATLDAETGEIHTPDAMDLAEKSPLGSYALASRYIQGLLRNETK